MATLMLPTSPTPTMLSFYLRASVFGRWWAAVIVGAGPFCLVMACCHTRRYISIGWTFVTFTPLHSNWATETWERTTLELIRRSCSGTLIKLWGCPQCRTSSPVVLIVEQHGHRGVRQGRLLLLLILRLLDGIWMVFFFLFIADTNELRLILYLNTRTQKRVPKQRSETR